MAKRVGRPPIQSANGFRVQASPLGEWGAVAAAGAAGVLVGGRPRTAGTPSSRWMWWVPTTVVTRRTAHTRLPLTGWRAASGAWVVVCWVLPWGVRPRSSTTRGGFVVGGATGRGGGRCLTVVCGRARRRGSAFSCKSSGGAGGEGDGVGGARVLYGRAFRAHRHR